MGLTAHGENLKLYKFVGSSTGPLITAEYATKSYNSRFPSHIDIKSPPLMHSFFTINNRLERRMTISEATPRLPMKNRALNTGMDGFRPLRKISVAMRGIYYAIILDAAVAYKVVLSTILLAVFFYHRQWIDFSLVLVVTGMVIISEIFNTAIESLCDFIESNQNDKIGIIKDISAGAVGISIFTWLVVIIIEIYRASTIFFLS